jgi:hypothetical protein
MVSVSRLAGLPHLGQAQSTKSGALRQRIAGAVGYAIFRQLDRQLVVGHRHRAAGVAMDQRNRAAPVALARNAPVAQAVLHLGVTEVLCIQVGGDGGDRGFVSQAVVLAGIDALAALLVGIPFLPAVQRESPRLRRRSPA